VSISLLELTGQIKTLRETVHQLSTTKNPSSATPSTTTTTTATPLTFPTTATLPNSRTVGGSWGENEVNTSKLLLLLNQNKEEPSFPTLKLLPDLLAHHAQFPFFPPGSNCVTLPSIASAARPEQPFSSLNKRTHPDGSQSLPSARRRLSSENFSDSSDEDQDDEDEEDENEESGDKDGKKPKKKRKGRGKLPEGATKMLTKWLLDHATAPYPTQDEKDRLIAETGLSCVQINNWFGNARRRILPAFHRKVYAPQPAPTVVL
jgi:hypothetical protein